MGSPADKYTSNMYTKFKRYAAWPLNQVVKLGDVGVLNGKIFEYRQNLSDLGYAFKSRGASKPIDENHSSGKDASVSFKAAGEAMPNSGLPVNEAGAKIAFGSQGAFIYQATGCVDEEIENKEALSTQILKWVKAGDWKQEWVVVDSVRTVQKAAILVSESDNAVVEVSGKGDLGTGGVSLATASAGLNVACKSGSVTHMVGKKAGLTPLFAVSRVKYSIWDHLVGGEGTVGRAMRSAGGGAKKKKASRVAEIKPSAILERVEVKPLKAAPKASKGGKARSAPRGKANAAGAGARTRAGAKATTRSAPRTRSR